MQSRRSARIAELPIAAPGPKKPRQQKQARTVPPAAADVNLPQARVVDVRSGDRPLSKDDTIVYWGAAADLVISASEKRCVKDAAARAEYHDSPAGAYAWSRSAHRVAEMRAKATALANLLKKAKHAVIFTGAGVSTAAGIGDYRGLTGAWTLQELAPKDDEVIDEGVPYETLRPTYTHEAVAKLMEMGLIKYVISQNCDGLHILSGVPDHLISELHGNVFKEFCVKCRKSHVRNYYVMDDSDESDNCPRCHFNHLTGRKCEAPGCRGELSDTIINFGDLLDEHTLTLATNNAKASDLFISLGSTMLVTPAATLIERASAAVICNRQKTNYDSTAAVRAFGDCDALFKLLMESVLGAEEEKKWSATLAKKRRTYDKLRAE